MDITFENLDTSHQTPVMDIFNYYIENSFAAFPCSVLPYAAFAKLLEKANGYPAYCVKDAGTDKVIGFCFLSPHSPFPTFRQTAEITYFISHQTTGRGIGKQCLSRLEEDAVRMGIRTILAIISSKNRMSLAFHEKNGFTATGRLKNVGRKFDELFDVVIMQKDLL